VAAHHDWTEKISLESGIADTVRWIKENIKLFSEISWDYIHKT